MDGGNQSAAAAVSAAPANGKAGAKASADLALSIRGLSKRFGRFTAVDGLALDLRPGELMALLGPSGCGKTTTLRMVAGLERPSAGEIRFGDRILVSIERAIELPPEKRNVGMVFQSYALWPHMTVFENVAYPLRLRGLAKAEIERKVAAVLDLVNLAGSTAKTVPQLSGGQQQRVALARALVYQPALMLFDEPFSNLDAQLRTQMRMELKMLRRKVEMTGLFVTHDQIEALSMADRIAIMNAGRIEQVGAPREVYKQPGTRFVRDFLGRVVNLRGTVAKGRVPAFLLGEGGGALSLGADLPAGLEAGDVAELSIRPEFIAVLGESEAGRPNTVQAAIEELLFTGENFEARLRIGADSALLDLPADRPWREGGQLRLHLPAEALSLWPIAGSGR